MDKEKVSRKRSSFDGKEPLPSPPPSPPSQTRSPSLQTSSPSYPEAFKRLLDYRKREQEFLKRLDETIAADCKKLRSEKMERNRQSTIEENNENRDTNAGLVKESSQQDAESTGAPLTRSESDQLRDECDQYITPLLNRSGPSIAAALVTYDAFDQLTKLHGLLNQMIQVRHQNYQMQKQIRNVHTLCELKKLQKKDSTEIADDAEVSDNELDLSAILAAGNSASTKRSTAKRQRERSKSVIADEIQMFASEKEKTSSLRRQSHQSAYSDSKAKVSKWTKVKAAFKWERANVATMNEGKSLDSGISLGPVNNEVARYLRVPSVPCAGSSADSVLSSSSGHLLSGGSVPATPGTISSASSIEDVGGVSEENRNNRDSSKSDSRCDSRANEEESRRSRSLDGDAVINSHSLTRDGKNKTPWKKVKDIIQTHRGSFKGKSRTRSIKSGGTCSREHSPCESIDAISNAEDRSYEHGAPSPTSPHPKTSPSLNVPYEGGSYPFSHNDGASSVQMREEPDGGRYHKSSSKSNRRSKVLTDFEVLPEDVIVDLRSTGRIHRSRPPPSPLNLRQDSSDAEYGDLSHSPIFFGKTPPKIFRSRKPLTSGNSSVPSSPSRHSEFFGESDNVFKFPDTNFAGDDFSSGDFSEPSSPHRNHHQKLSPKSSFLLQQKEINEKYFELCEQLAQEFEAKQEEWKKIQAACAASASTAYQIMSKDEGSLSSKNVPATLLEENLSPDFKKKLHKWRVKKQNSVTHKDPQTSPTKENEQKKIDWNLWKTGQLKLEGQGLTPMPDQKDLSEDFQKKLEQWRKLKESNTVPPYNSQDSLKRSKKPKDDSEKYDRDKNRPEREKLKVHEKDKLEKLSKLKAIVTDSAAKEIEVKTSKGVMKFEGISRKFTRKLYEWEKARGIGPESSTFALLHPGYRPLDVGNGLQDNTIQDNSPVLGRSLSLDSVAPNPSIPAISHQPSSLSLNDMKESNSTPEGLDECEKTVLSENLSRQQDEPEAVIVEVEDDIIETAAPLMAAHPMVEHQTPVYRYEIPCPELCSGTQTLSFDNAPSLQRQRSTQALQDVTNLKRLQSQQDDDFKEHVQHVQTVLKSLKESLPDLESCVRSGSPKGIETILAIKRLVQEIVEMLNSLMLLDSVNVEFKERSRSIDMKLACLQRNIDLICKIIEAKKFNEPIPEIKIISEDTSGVGRAIVCTTPTVFQTEVVVNQPRVLFDNSTVNEPPPVMDQNRLDPGEGPSKKVNRTVSNGSKKKMRLRKMGSRQNSKTESDSDEESINITLEAPRRVKRKTSKAKAKADDDKKPIGFEEKKEDGFGSEDIVYVLKVKPGQKIEQEVKQDSNSERNVLISPQELCVELLEVAPEPVSSSASIFVKTKRKVFTTVDEPSCSDSKVVVAKELDSSSTSERTSRESSVCDPEKSKTQASSSLPPIPQSPNAQRRLDVKTSPLKELSPSIRMMIQKYNQTVEKSTRVRSGSASPIYRSPILERRIKARNEKYQNSADTVVKSSSAGNIQQTGLVVVNIPDIDYSSDGECKLPKSSSAEVLPSDRKLSLQGNEEDCPVSLPLASDSLRIIKVPTTPAMTSSPPEKEKKEHLYKKHKEKPTTLFSKTGAVKKLGLKTGKASENIWRRSVSSTPSETWGFPDKSDNTVPRISRKYDAADAYSKSAPSTPMTEEYEPPKTPLSERALKIQRAKEEFLNRDIQRSSTWETSGNKDSIWQKRLSSSSFGSTASNELQAGMLLKSASVGLIGSVPNENLSEDDLTISIPRPPEKSSKFGFSSIASKFRKVKMRRGKEQSPKYGAISALCRQSLAVVDMHADAVALQEQLKQVEIENTQVQKSSSSHGFWSGFKKLDKLSKSKSANLLPQYDKDTKEM